MLLIFLRPSCPMSSRINGSFFSLVGGSSLRPKRGQTQISHSHCHFKCPNIPRTLCCSIVAVSDHCFNSLYEPLDRPLVDRWSIIPLWHRLMSGILVVIVNILIHLAHSAGGEGGTKDPFQAARAHAHNTFKGASDEQLKALNTTNESEDTVPITFKWLKKGAIRASPENIKRKVTYNPKSISVFAAMRKDGLVSLQFRNQETSGLNSCIARDHKLFRESRGRR